MYHVSAANKKVRSWPASVYAAKEVSKKILTEITTVKKEMTQSQSAGKDSIIYDPGMSQYSNSISYLRY